MELSKAERLMIAMLADIHRATVPAGTGHIDPAFVDEAISFNPWALKWAYSHLLGDEEDVSDETAEQVGRHMTMWSVIEADYGRLSTDDQKAVRDAHRYGAEPVFSGYDGNNESDHHSAARMIIGPLGRFSEFSGRDMNSHAPSVDHYERMQEEFDAIVRADGLRNTPLSADQMITILNA